MQIYDVSFTGVNIQELQAFPSLQYINASEFSFQDKNFVKMKLL